VINEIEKQRMSGRRGITKADYQAKGVLYLPENARFSVTTHPCVNPIEPTEGINGDPLNAS